MATTWQAAENRSDLRAYWALCAILGAMLVFEWAVFALELGNPAVREALHTPFLMMAAVKFAMVVGWAMNLRSDPGPLRKGGVVALALGGGNLAALATLL